MATANSRKRLAASQPGASRAGATGGAPQPTAVNSLMEEIRSFGRLPRRVRGQEAAQKAERRLANRMIRAKDNQLFSEEQLAELDELGGAAQPVDVSQLMQEIRSFGRLPRRVRGQEPAQKAERALADRMIRKEQPMLFRRTAGGA